MHQANGLFDPSTPDRRSALNPEPFSDGQSTCHGITPPSANADGIDGVNGTPSSVANGESGPDWSSAVGHAATGKSGRVIHNLQEDIARLTRELTLHRSRAEEAQHSNETLKEQIVNLSERLRNSEQSNETNLTSIARKDRKIEELRLEIQTERTRRQKAEAEAAKVNQLMSENREDFHRKCAEMQETTNYATTQYDALAKSTLREKSDLQKKFKGVRDELRTLRHELDQKDKEQERLDALIDRQNQEVEAERNRIGGIFEAYGSYKSLRDKEIRDLLEKGHLNEATIDTALASLKETEDKMKWIMQTKKQISWAE